VGREQVLGLERQAGQCIEVVGDARCRSRTVSVLLVVF
jgi:hypothetical protein